MDQLKKKCGIFSHLGFWNGSLFLIAPFPDLCLLVLFFEGRENKLNHSGCLLSQILFHSFVCLCYMYFLFILLPHFVLFMYVPIL